MQEKHNTDAAIPECGDMHEQKNGKPHGSGVRSFFADVAAGFGIGVAFIIPGFSGGSMAAIFGIYERLIGAIADIFKTPKKSIITLIPIFVGLCIGAVSLLYPLGWALEAFPIPTVSLFVGLALGGTLSISDKIKGRISAANIAAFVIPALVAVVLMLAPTGADVDLFDLNFGGYLLLFLVGVLGSSALVVPGISGSMILLILGYYNPIIQLITQHFLKGEDMLVSFLVLMSVGLGIVVGFIGISMLMKRLLARYNRGTHFAIIGFIVGSVPTAFVATAKDAGYTDSALPSDVWYWVCSAVLLLIGLAAAAFVVIRARRVLSDRSGK